MSLEYLADMVRLLAPEEIVKLLTHFAAALDKDAKEVQAGLQVGQLPTTPASSQDPARS